MSSGYGENSKPNGNSKAYVSNDKLWDNLAAEKKRKLDELTQVSQEMGQYDDVPPFKRVKDGGDK